MKSYWYRTGLLTLGLFVLTGCSTNNNSVSTSTIIHTYNKKVEIFARGAANLSAVDMTTAYSNDENIKEIPNDETIYDEIIVLDYLDYDKIFVNDNNNMSPDPRYANVTPDGKFDWRQEYQGEDRPNLPQLYEQITFNGKPITLPTTFAELDPAYAAFDNLSLHNVTKDNLKMTFENTDNQYRAVFKERVTSSSDSLHFVKLYQASTGKIHASVDVENFKPQKIVGLQSVLWSSMTSEDLRVAGISIGSTFNEMYEVFGEPTTVFSASGSRFVTYRAGKGVYLVMFASTPRITNPMTGELGTVYDNVITEMSVSKFK